MNHARPHALVFGTGQVGIAFARDRLCEGWSVGGTSRSAERRHVLAAAGIEAVDPDDAASLQDQLRRARAVLVTAPPTSEGCPGLNTIVPLLARAGAYPDWLGYLSSTGVYGDRAGRWVFEDSPLLARSIEGARRVGAERDWLEVGRGMGLTVQIFRLPGIYGPGSCALDRVRTGKARRIVKPGQVFSRIHVNDIVSALTGSMGRPRPAAIYNICDDVPSPPQDVISFASQLLGVEPPPEQRVEDSGSAAQSRFFTESKRVSNALIKAETGWRPYYPDYRSGLSAILAGENSSAMH